MNSKKIKIILSIFFTLFFIINIFYFPILTKANNSMPNLVMPDLQIDIGGLKDKFLNKDNSIIPTKCGINKDSICINWIGEYISAIYKYSIGIVGILAAVILMVGGIIWLTAGGNASMITEAKAWITASLTGLILALCSYTILYQINPNLLEFKPLKITQIKKIVDNNGFIPQRSGLDICATKKNNNGIKLGAGAKADSEIPWISEDINIITDVRNAKITCEKYCFASNLCRTKRSPFSTPDDCISDFSLSNDRKIICCACYETPKINSLSVANTIKINFTFDEQIEFQVVDASNALLNFLSCMNTKLPKGETRRISSISDSAHPSAKMAECNRYNCPESCAHACNSCHYGGGGKTAKSFAVDFGNGGKDKSSTINNTIEKAAKDCNAKFINIESNHIHISVGACNKK